MTVLTVTTREGDVHVLEADLGVSVMEIIRDAGIDELLALCGGCCSCATCHVHIDQQDYTNLEPRSEDEDDLLDSSDHRSETSRLSCQIMITKGMRDLRVTIADED